MFQLIHSLRHMDIPPSTNKQDAVSYTNCCLQFRHTYTLTCTWRSEFIITVALVSFVVSTTLYLLPKLCSRIGMNDTECRHFSMTAAPDWGSHGFTSWSIDCLFRHTISWFSAAHPDRWQDNKPFDVANSKSYHVTINISYDVTISFSTPILIHYLRIKLPLDDIWQGCPSTRPSEEAL